MMIARELIATAPVPGGAALRLVRRGGDFMIMVGGTELMSSRLSGSEVALASLACARLVGRPAITILIGGLGMGFTLRAALAALGADTAIVVAELVPAVIAWARGPMAALHGDSLDDPRVTIVAGDVAMSIAAGIATYDAILLDVDNGPDGLTTGANDRLYSALGLSAAKAALRPGGILAIWSAAPDPRFTRRLVDAGLAVDEIPVRARHGRGARHMIWLATRSA